MFYARENRTRLRSLLVDPSSLDSSTDIGQRRQGPGAGGMPHPSLLSLWPVIMDWGGRGAGLGTSCRTEPGQRKGYGRQAGCCGPELGVWGWPMAWGGLTYVHILLLRTSGGPHCSRSRGPGGGRRPQPLCSCPPAAGHTPYSTRSRR